MNPTSIHRTRVRSLVLLSGLRIWHWCELWCRLQTRLTSGVAVAGASRCCSDSTPSLGTPICHGCGPKKQNKNKQKKLVFKTPCNRTPQEHAKISCSWVLLSVWCLRLSEVAIQESGFFEQASPLTTERIKDTKLLTSQGRSRAPASRNSHFHHKGDRGNESKAQPFSAFQC